MSKKKCPICGAEMKIDTSAVCISIPPKYRCVCPSCNCLDFIETSEYDQYKEEPSLPSDLDEAAEEYTQKMLESWRFDSTGCRPPRESFIAGANWQKKQMLKEAVEGTVMDFSSNRPRPQVDVLLDPHKYHTGDKVRIIIVKEEE